MTTRPRFTASAVHLLSIASFATAEPLPEQLTFVRSASGVSSSDWPGVAKRTYFYQSSPDLVTWSFAPFMTFGIGPHHYEMTSSPEKLFFRLNYVDDTLITTPQQARDADFDNDGIPNSYEIETISTNPLDKNSTGGDSDNDGLPDGWELFHFGGLKIANPIAILKPDGLTNKEKADLGLNPNVDYTSASTAQPASYTYDLTGRLTGVTAPVGTSNYAPDEEGNLLNAQ